MIHLNPEGLGTHLNAFQKHQAPTFLFLSDSHKHTLMLLPLVLDLKDLGGIGWTGMEKNGSDGNMY